VAGDTFDGGLDALAGETLDGDGLDIVAGDTLDGNLDTVHAAT
jgi:hypothetical protein